MAAALSIALLLLVHAAATTGALELHFYRSSCPRAELIVKRVVQKYVQKDPSVPAGLLRLHFHDCFIRGCDGSVLVDSTDDNIAEKEAPPNLTLRTFELIDEIKDELEEECSGVVSCADILALATRDGVALSGGENYALPTGRRDGTISAMADVHLPSPSWTVQAAENAFKAINLTLEDLTTLLGAHSVGLCHCGFFIDRLYDFHGTGLADPDIDPGLFRNLTHKCPPEVVQINNITKDPTVFMNQVSTTPFILGTSFYRAVLHNKALLQLDQRLAFTDITSTLAVTYIRNPRFFISQFSKTMIKLGNVGVLTGKDGVIRLNCRKINNDTSGDY